MFKLDRILGISCEGVNMYTARKELHFSQFTHIKGIRNICRRRDLSDEVCSLSFRSQLLPFQVRILHSILQHMITPRQGHTDETTRLDVGLLDSLIQGRQMHLSFTILRHMLSTTVVFNMSFPYGSIISKILRHFHVPLTEPVYVETKKMGRKIILRISFQWRQGKWIKVTSSFSMTFSLRMSYPTFALELDHMPLVKQQQHPLKMTSQLSQPCQLYLLQHLLILRTVFSSSSTKWMHFNQTLRLFDSRSQISRQSDLLDSAAFFVTLAMIPTIPLHCPHLSFLHLYISHKHYSSHVVVVVLFGLIVLVMFL